MATKVLPPKQYDDAKLQAMTEPLFVRVEKITGGRRQPIPLPASEEAPDEPGGTNYDKVSVRGLEQFLVTEWSGGGQYSIKVTDAAGQVMEWMPSWNTDQFPERTPPLLQQAYNPYAPPPTPRKRTNVPSFPSGFPSFQQFMQQQQQPQQQPQYAYPPPYPYPPLPPPYAYGMPPVGPRSLSCVIKISGSSARCGIRTKP